MQKKNVSKTNSTFSSFCPSWQATEAKELREFSIWMYVCTMYYAKMITTQFSHIVTYYYYHRACITTILYCIGQNEKFMKIVNHFRGVS